MTRNYDVLIDSINACVVYSILRINIHLHKRSFLVNIASHQSGAVTVGG
ncbi:hypothetical protein [Chromatium okenii]|nr:hypothetical protein [Chromatium okenii]